MTVFEHDCLARQIEELRVVGHVSLDTAAVDLDRAETKLQRRRHVAGKAPAGGIVRARYRNRVTYITS